MAGKRKTTALRLDMLPPAQRRLWDELGDTPQQFVLYGGTAIALRLGHRQSADFDFFALESADVRSLPSTVAYLAQAEVQFTSQGTLTCQVTRGQEVSISYFCVDTLRSVLPAEQIARPRLRLASMIDLAGMKMATVTQRASAKDYRDVYAILDQTAITLADAIGAASVIYGTQYNPLITLKSLTYFGDRDLPKLPVKIKRGLTRAVSEFDLATIPSHDELKRKHQR